MIMSQRPFLTIISPVYRAEKIVDELVSRIREEASKITNNYEIILIEDCGPDDSWAKIVENCNKFQEVKGIKLSRNFGQHFAITCGIDYANGDYVIVMDCDLQDDPKYFSKFIEETKNGCDIVFSYKEKRKHNFIKDFFANLFNIVFNYLIENKSQKSNAMVGSYSLLSRKAVLAFRAYGDYQRHYLMVLRWLGFKNAYISIEHNKRFEGKSSYSFSKLLNHSLNGITSQSDKLLRLNATIGLGLSFLSFIIAIIIVIFYFKYGFLSGWASLIVTILFSTGILLTSIGITGIYIGKTFEQTKNRPKYIVDDLVNLKLDN
jgi:glycosyltransferase involved in cell wall biosynthesis